MTDDHPDYDSDDQFEAEAIDEDVVDGQSFPPDRPQGVADALARDVTVPGEEVLDSLAERIAREEPELAPTPSGDRDLRAGIIEDDDDELEGELAEGDDDEFVLSDSVGATRDDRSAEELALHLETEPEDETLTEILEDHEERRP
jgi:hypothetical protein